MKKSRAQLLRKNYSWSLDIHWRNNASVNQRTKKLVEGQLLFSQKGIFKLEQFLKQFNEICDKLSSIRKSIPNDDKVFQLVSALGLNYADFKMAMHTKPIYPNLKQFVLALLNHKQTVIIQKDEEKTTREHNQRTQLHKTRMKQK